MDASHLVHDIKHDGGNVLCHASRGGANVEKIQDLLDRRQHVATTNLRRFLTEEGRLGGGGGGKEGRRGG